MATKYEEIAAWANEQLEGESFGPGSRFYSENELCALHSASRQTVRQALDILEKDGLLQRRRGSGTYVLDSRRHRPLGRTIGVVSTYFSDYIFPGIITGIEKELNRHSYGIQVATTGNQLENEQKTLRQMLDAGVSGLIVEPTRSALPNPNQALYVKIKKEGIPLVFFNVRYPWADFPLVALDDVKAGRVAAECLVVAGHRRIAGIFKSDDAQGHLRYQGYLESLEKAGISPGAAQVLWYTTEDKTSLFEYPGRVWDLLGDCTAVVCYNDELAARFLAFCKQEGREVPRQLSVVGVDDASISALCHPPLTTVANPTQQLGEQAASAVLAQIEHTGASVVKLFPPRLVVRHSVAKPE